MSGDRSESEPGDGEWLTVAAAGRRLGISPRAIRGRIRRGTIEWKPAGNTGRLVLVRPGDAVGDDPGTEPGDDLDQLREELLEARVALGRAEERVAAATAEARVAQARAEERAAALRELVDELKAQLAVTRAPWWRRWRSG